jgi:hypothetical protein
MFLELFALEVYRNRSGYVTWCERHPACCPILGDRRPRTRRIEALLGVFRRPISLPRNCDRFFGRLRCAAMLLGGVGSVRYPLPPASRRAGKPERTTILTNYFRQCSDPLSTTAMPGQGTARHRQSFSSFSVLEALSLPQPAPRPRSLPRRPSVLPSGLRETRPVDDGPAPPPPASASAASSDPGVRRRRHRCWALPPLFARATPIGRRTVARRRRPRLPGIPGSRTNWV